MHDIYIAFISFTLRFADTCTHSVPIFVSAKQIYCCRLRAVSVTQGAEEGGLFSVNLNKQSSYLVI